MVLPISKTISKLETYSDSSYSILSIYLSIPEGVKNINRRLLHNFHRVVEEHLDEREAVSLKKDIMYMEGYLEQFENTQDYKSLAMFSGNDTLWEVITGHFSVPNLAHISHTPYLDPIFASTSDFKRYLVVLADKEKAKFFTIISDQLEDYGEVFDPSFPQKVKGRNIPELSGKIERHIQMHELWHFKKISTAVTDFIRGKYINGVLIGGHTETLHFLEEKLSRELQKKVLGRFVSELNVSTNQLLEEAMKEIERHDQSLVEKRQRANRFTFS